MAVCLSGRDGKATGQDGPGKHDDDEVIDDEVPGPADDSLRRALGGPLTVMTYVDLAPEDRHAILLRFLDELQDPTDDKGTGDVTTVQALLHQTDPDQGGSDLGTGHDRRTLGVLNKPRDRRPHQISIPNCVLNRTSPSNISRMSLTPWRSISARSMPMPNAKPVYRSGSMPQALNTSRLTIPQPPHSIHPVPPQVRQCSSEPPQMKHRKSSSALGSVKGK